MNPPIEVFPIDNHLVFCGLQRGGYVGRGYRIVIPDVEHATETWQRNLEDNLRVLLVSCQKTMRMQFRWCNTSDYKEQLLKYQRTTEALEKNASGWSLRSRSRIFTSLWDQYERRDLRREVCQVFITSQITSSSLTKKTGREGYRLLFEAAKRDLAYQEEGARQLFSSIGGAFVPMTTEEHFDAYYSFFNPAALDAVDFRPHEKADLSGQIGLIEQTFFSEPSPLHKPDFGFYSGGYYHGQIVLQTKPRYTEIGMIGRLTGLAMRDYEITVNIVPENVDELIDREQAEYDKLGTAISRGGGLQMQHSYKVRGERILALLSNQVFPFRAQFIIRAWDKTKEGLAAKLTTLRSQLAKMFGARGYDPAFYISSRNFYYATIPGWSWDKYRDCEFAVNDVNLTDLLPISTTSHGDLENAEALYKGNNGQLIGIQTFSGRKGQETPRHALMGGGSRSGKSVMSNDLITQISPYYGYFCFIEEGNSWGLTAQLLDPKARSVAIRSNGNLCFNYLDTARLPLSSLALADGIGMAKVLIGSSGSDDTDNLREAHIATTLKQIYSDHYRQWSLNHSDQVSEVAREAVAILGRARKCLPEDTSFVEAFLDWRQFSLERPDEAADTLAAVTEEEIIKLQADPATEDLVRDLAYARIVPDEQPRHSHLQELLFMESHGRGIEAEEKRVLARLLEPWNDGGNYGPIVDGITNVDLSGRAVHFELGQISESAPRLRGVAAYLITNRIRNEIMMRPRSERKCVVMEELLALAQMPGGSKIIAEFFERAAKYNGWILAILQQIARMQTPQMEPILASVMGNTKLTFLLRQEERTDLDRITKYKPIPDSAKSTIYSFPDPTQARENPYSGFCYMSAGDGAPIITFGRHYADAESLYVTSSSGAHYEARRKQLAQASTLLDGVIKFANQSEPISAA